MFDEWEGFAEKYFKNKSILVAEIDCEPYKKLCQKFNVRRYPAIIMFKNGKKFEKYVDERKKDDFIAYVEDVLNGKESENISKDEN